MPTTDSTSTNGAKNRDASGNNGRQYRRNPNVPTLCRTPTSSTAPPMGASEPESGSHVWNGTSGALIANATKKPRKSQICVDSGSVAAIDWSSTQEKVASPSTSPLTTYSPITDASMISPPSSEYRKNFTAAYWRFGPPKRPIMKYIGTSMASKNT